jgi:di/tricarboxylate transporter
MTLEIALVLAILVASLVLFVTEWVRMDLVALLVLSALAISGILTPTEALSGFSNPAVITVWAMFILSEGLTRAGIADAIGRGVIQASGRSEMRMIVTLMLVGGVLSAFMNNIGVAALLLPVAIEAARQAGIAPSRLLMPMAYGTLLGGLMTLIGTPPNLLVSSALREAGHGGFRFFDFSWVGLPILLAGTAFVALLGRHLLPRTDTTRAPDGRNDLESQYGLQERIFALRIPPGTVLAAKTIAESGLTTAAGLLIIALTRAGHTRALPDRSTQLQAGDVLLAQGQLKQLELLQRWSTIAIDREAPVLHALLRKKAVLRELLVAEKSALIDEPLDHRRFRERYGANVLAVRRGSEVRRTRLAEIKLAYGDRLLVQCPETALEGFEDSEDFSAMAPVTEADLKENYRLEERLFVLRVPRDASMAGMTVGDSHVADVFDFRLMALFREGELLESPGSEESLLPGDLLLIQGREQDLDVLRGLQQVDVLEDAARYQGLFREGRLELVEAVLHPHAKVAGKTIAELQLHDRYRVRVAAIWRNGKPMRSSLGSLRVEPGDALLIVGPRRQLAALSADQDLIVLNPVQAPAIDASKAPLAGALMFLVVASVLAGFLTIAIAAVAGAALMVLTRCLTMEQAYRAIDWRSIFLIAGMLPLGIAMHQTGAAEYLAGGVLAMIGPLGPWPVIAGLYLVTSLATLIVPTAALVLLMAPIALSTSAELGIAPYAPVMAVAIAASASLASPVSHPANVLVMGPGGYRFVDYLRLGLPLTLLTFLVTALLLPVFWPLH